MCGGGSVADELAAHALLTVETAAGLLPMWTDWGVHDAGHLVHSLGCTFLTAIGRDAGFASVSEVPSGHAMGRSRMCKKMCGPIQSGSTAGTRRVSLIAEFERYAGKQRTSAQRSRRCCSRSTAGAAKTRPCSSPIGVSDSSQCLITRASVPSCAEGSTRREAFVCQALHAHS